MTAPQLGSVAIKGGLRSCLVLDKASTRRLVAQTTPAKLISRSLGMQGPWRAQNSNQRTSRRS